MPSTILTLQPFFDFTHLIKFRDGTEEEKKIYFLQFDADEMKNSLKRVIKNNIKLFTHLCIGCSWRSTDDNCVDLNFISVDSILAI
jgi:uncharacterized radical SAM superfamily protein